MLDCGLVYSLALATHLMQHYEIESGWVVSGVLPLAMRRVVIKGVFTFATGAFTFFRESCSSLAGFWNIHQKILDIMLLAVYVGHLLKAGFVFSAGYVELDTYAFHL